MSCLLVVNEGYPFFMLTTTIQIAQTKRSLKTHLFGKSDLTLVIFKYYIVQLFVELALQYFFNFLFRKLA